MEFVKQLTERQVREFAGKLIILSEKRDFHISLSREDSPWNLEEEKGGWTMQIRFYCIKQHYDITLRLGDYEIIAYQTGKLSEETIKKEYVQFMHQVFGEEYKTAYLENAAKIFEK